MSKLRMMYTLNKQFGMNTIVGPARILERLISEAAAVGVSPPGGMKRTPLINYLHDHLTPNYRGTLLVFRDPNDVRASRSGYIAALKLAQTTMRKQSKAEKEQAKLMSKAREKKRLRADAIYQKRSREAAVRAGAVLGGGPRNGRFVRTIPQPPTATQTPPRVSFSRPWREAAAEAAREAGAGVPTSPNLGRLRNAMFDEPFLEDELDTSESL